MSTMLDVCPGRIDIERIEAIETLVAVCGHCVQMFGSRWLLETMARRCRDSFGASTFGASGSSPPSTPLCKFRRRLCRSNVASFEPVAEAADLAGGTGVVGGERSVLFCHPWPGWLHETLLAVSDGALELLGR